MVSFSRNSVAQYQTHRDHKFRWSVSKNNRANVHFSLFPPSPLLSLFSAGARANSLITNRKKVRRCRPTFLPLLIKISSGVPRVEPHADACTASNYVRRDTEEYPPREKHRAFPGRRTPLMDKLLNLGLSLDSIYYALRAENLFSIVDLVDRLFHSCISLTLSLYVREDSDFHSIILIFIEFEELSFKRQFLGNSRLQRFIFWVVMGIY